MVRFILTCIVVALLFPAATSAQNAFMDSIGTSFHHTPKLDFRLDARNSFIGTRAARINGVKLGLDFNEKVKVGLGYHWLVTDLNSTRITFGAEGEALETPTQLRFRYMAPYFEYSFFKKGKWEAAIPVMLGIGTARYEYKNQVGREVLTEGKTIILYEPFMTTHYNVTNWFAVGGGVGYRLLLAGNGALPENFNSPMYVVKTKLSFGQIYKHLKRSK